MIDSRRMPVRALAFGAVLIGVLGLLTVQPQIAATAAEGNSSVRVEWNGGNDPELQRYQPDRSAMVDNADGSGKWLDFEDLEVTVSQTRNLRDQAVTVSFEGLAPTELAGDGMGGTFANNYLQLMQCWGEDPLAADFRETCQFGSWSTEAGFDVVQGAAMRDGSGFMTTGRGMHSELAGNGLMRWGEPFRTVTGATNAPSIPDPKRNTLINGVADYFSPSSSNEQVLVRSVDGRGSVQFETQSAALNPYLGCGDPDAAGERCWLVVVPRGTHTGAMKDASDACEGQYEIGGGFGSKTRVQTGSPLDRNCTFWDDRIVVPLDFQPTEPPCPAGTAERRTTGSQLAAEVMSSWQGELCADDGDVFTLSTTPGPLSRGQLLNGQSSFAFVGRDVNPNDLDEVDASLLEQIRLRYAPVTNTGVVIAFINDHTTMKFTDLNLSPRLVAKLLTTSYASDGLGISGDPTLWFGSHYSNDLALQNDPEFQQLNPGTLILGGGHFRLITPGPQGDDPFLKVWQWIQADDAARAWLGGEPDNVRPGDEGNTGMTVNPYFLPRGHPRALGGGLEVNLATDPVDAFPKADQTLAPDVETARQKYNGLQLDSLQMNPYSESLSAIGKRVFRADPQTVNYWDDEKYNGGGAKGAWVSTGPSPMITGRGVAGLVDAATAERYGLHVAALQRPNSDDFVLPTQASIAAGINASASDGTTANTTDYSRLTDGAYPLAQTVYGAVDIDSPNLDEAARESYASLLDYAASNAPQIVGDLPGQLPPGNAPLTKEQRATTTLVAAELRDPPARSEAELPGDDEPTDSGLGEVTASSPAAGGGGAEQANSPAPGPGGSTAVTTEAAGLVAGGTTAAAASATGPLVFGGSALVGLAGLAAAPFLLRRRTTTG